ncbi:MAG: hypothetical protein ABH951_02420 [Patescibacteria group bacterium]
MKFIIKNLFVIVLLAFIFFVPVLSFAQGVIIPSPPPSTPTNPPTSYVTIVNPINVTSVNDFIRILLEGVLKIGIPIVALAIIYSGFLFVTARGVPESLKKAKDAFLYSVIGAAILLGAWAIAQLISDTVLQVAS